MSPPEPVDFFDIRALLDDDERLIRDTVARFVDREVAPLMAECFAAERFPSELVPRLAELGLFGATLRGYGCAGLSHTAYGLICEELERGDSSIRSCVSVQSSLVMGCIFACGSEEQRSRWLPELARGTKLGCFALDRGARRLGSRRACARTRGDTAAIGRSTARSCGSRTVRWPMSPSYGRRPTTASRHFLVEKGTSGFRSHVIKNKFSLRASSTAELELADVRVPDSARLPERQRSQGRASLPRRGALWDRVGRLRCSARLHRHRVELHAVPRAVRPSAEPHAADSNAARERRSPAHGSATTGVAACETQRSRRCDHGAHIAGEVEQRACGARCRA